jgi:hypothetical protein
LFVQIGSGANQAAGTERPYLEPLQALAYDASGSPVPGTSVTFTSPSSGPTAVSVDNGNLISERTTNERGIATIDITANHIPGDFIVTATIPDQDSTALFYLSNLNIYISPSGSDTNNDCRKPGTPCKSLQYSLTKTKANATIYMAGGTYEITNTSIGLQSLWILGGWNSEFTLQDSQTLIKGKGYTLSVQAKYTKIANVILSELATGLQVGGYGTVVENVSIINNEIGISNNNVLKVINSTISGNKKSGLRNSSQVTLIHTTIANNLGSAIEQTGLVSPVYIQNSIIAPLQNCYLLVESFYSLGYNILNPECGSAINRHSTDIISFNPKISPLINQSYHALLPGSPAIDAINLDMPGTSCLLSDQRGMSRPSGSNCDIGAYEYTVPSNQVKLLIHNGSEQAIGPLQTPILPLEVVLLDEVGSPVSGVNVTFVSPASGPSGTFSNNSTSTVVTSDDSGIASITTYRANTLPGSYNLQVNASGLVGIILFPLSNGNNLYVSTLNSNDTANDCRNINFPCKTLKRATDAASSGDMIYVASGYYPTVTVTINKNLYISGGWNDNFTVQNGTTLQEQLSSNPQLTVNASAFVHIDRFDYRGGYQVINNLGSLQLRNSSFRKSCTAVSNSGQADIRNVTISENSCAWNNAAGIRNTSGQIQLTNVTISSNTGFDSNVPYNRLRLGGGISNAEGRVFIKNSILTGNRTNLGFECSGNIHSLGSNIVSITDGCGWIPAEGDMLGTLNKPFDARLAGLTTNENGPFIRPPLKDSPAIDSADPSACPSSDQIGQARPEGEGCDIGAYEGFVVDQSKPYAITYTAKNGYYWPGSLLCRSPQDNCTGGEDMDADLAHTHALNFLQFILDRHNRNGVEGAGYPLISTVHHGDENYKNAFWTHLGFQVVYGNSFSRVDDVVAHEIMHGITRTTSNLFYYYQSGAINESLSDLWGEYYDQLNGLGNDSAAFKWLIGEDLPSSIGVIRNMKNPPAFKDPDKMTSVYYYKGSHDNGGVHWNSGVNNKAVYLMVDGGTFNGRTVNGIGWEKTAAIYYYAQSRLLTSASDYADLQNTLDQACTSLTGGAEGITTDDCNQVRYATMAVEMNKFPIPNFNPDVSYCPTGFDKYPTDLYLDDFENGAANWEFDMFNSNNRWSIASSEVDIAFATSGDHALYGNDYNKYDYEQRTDTRAIMANGVKIPASLMTMLHFNHAFGFEWYFDSATGTSYYIDGAIVEYSTDGGVTWKDAKSLFSDGRNYNGTIYNDTSYGYNPLRNRAGFVGDSHGYVSSRYNLSSLAGKTVRFRFRMGTDKEYSNLGWFIDDVRIYTCIGAAAVPVLGTPANSSLTTNFKPKLDWYNTDNADHYELEVATDTAFTNLIFSKQDLSVSEYTFTSALAANTRYYWRVRAVNQINAASAWSTTWSFRTALTPPAIETPANGSIPDSLRPTFRWTASPGAASYSLVISTFSNFTTPLVDITGPDLSYSPTVNLPANVPIYWRVRANGTNTSAWTSASFTSPNPPGSPGLSSPASNAIVYTYTPLLKWNASSVPAGSPALASYHLQFDDDADFSSPLYDQAGLTERTFTVPDPISANQKFYWRVKAVNVAGQYSAWSSRSLRTAIVPPELTAPASDFVTDSLRPAFEWSSSTGATGYTLVVSTLADFTTPLINITQPATSYTPSVDLPAGAKLYWRVRAEGANPSAWASSSFMIPVPPTKPGLSSPASAAKIYTYTPILKWNASVIPAGAPALAYYQLQVDNDADYSSLLYDQTELTATSFTIPEALTPNQKFYWRVRAVNILGQYSSWSARTFSTTIVPPVIQSPVTEFVTDGLRPKFEWSSSPGATSYTLILSTLPDFTTPLINITQATTSYTPTMDLPTGAKLYWRVRANGTNASAWTASSFMIPVPPAKPALSSPASNALVRHDAILLKWNASVIAAGAPALAYYQVQFDDTADYSSPLYQADLTERTFTIPDALPANQKFYWRVRAVNILGQNSSWSSRTLRTRIISPVIDIPEAGSLQDSLRPTFGWSSTQHAASYTIIVSSFADYSSPLVNVTTSAQALCPQLIYLPARLSTGG